MAASFDGLQATKLDISHATPCLALLQGGESVGFAEGR